MAPRDLMSSSAMETVFDNLGMTQDDLNGGGNDGLGTDDDFGDTGDDDLGDGADDQFADGGDEDPFAIDDGFDDQRRVSHTDDRQQQRGRQDNRQPQNGRQQQPGRQPGSPQFQPRRVRPDAKGNLVDDKGVIVARAGTERRYYEDVQKWRRESSQKDVQLRGVAGRLNRVTQIAQRLKSENDSFVAQQNAIKELGVSSQDQIDAIQLFTQLKRDAKGTLQKLLTRAAANGIMLDNSGSGNNGGQPDIGGVVKELLGSELKPLKEFVANQQRLEQANRASAEQRVQVQQEVDDWFGQHPQARPYAEVFSKVLRNPEFSQMSLGEIWARIQLNLERQRKAGGQRSSGRNGFTPRGGRRGSPPIGRGSPPSGNMEMADVNASWDSIVKDVLDQAGV